MYHLKCMWREETLSKNSVHICNSIITLIYLQRICHKINIFIKHITSMHAQSLSRVQLFTTPWTVCSPPGSSVHGPFQTRILEWVAISFSGDLPNPGIKPMSPAFEADSLPLSHQRSKLIGL